MKEIKPLKVFLLLQLCLFYLLSLPVTSHFLFTTLETSSALTAEQLKNTSADIIVVLAGGIKAYKKEYQGADISGFTIPRLRYAAYLQKRTGLPLIVTGGIEKAETTEADLMHKVLREEYQLDTRIYIENQSQNTFENAVNVKQLLQELHYQHILLVSSAFHMPRALAVFEEAEIKVTPAPTDYYYNRMDYQFGDFLPNSLALRHTYLALHELIGAFWYRLIS